MAKNSGTRSRKDVKTPEVPIGESVYHHLRRHHWVFHDWVRKVWNAWAEHLAEWQVPDAAARVVRAGLVQVGASGPFVV